MSIKFEYKTDNKTENFIKKVSKMRLKAVLDSYGRSGVRMLSEATPKRTGKTAESWSYKIDEQETSSSLSFHNSNKSGEGKGSIPVVQLIRYGHTTKNGGYVAPNDFVSPIAEKVFNDAIENVWGMYRKGK